MSQKHAPRSWRIRKWLWTRWQTFRMSVSKPVKIVAPKPNKETIKAIAMREKHPKIPIDILVYDRIPSDESKLTARIFVAIQLFLNRLFPAMQRNLPEIDPDINRALDQALMPKYGKAFRTPVLPPIYDGEGKPELEDLAVQSPYSIFLERDFVNMFSFSYDGLTSYYDAMHKKYDIAMVDPNADWKRRGLTGSQFHCPTQDNLREVFGLMHGHAKRYVDAYYESDEALQEDEDVQEWLSALGDIVPNGLGDFVADGVTRDGLARLIGGYINEGNTIHDMVGTTLWDYQLWVDKNPVRIQRDGRRIPLDVLQRAINNNFGLQLRRAPLLANYKDVALDEKGAALFTQFYEECRALQDRYDKDPTGPWRMEPKNLEISMNG